MDLYLLIGTGVMECCLDFFGMFFMAFMAQMDSRAAVCCILEFFVLYYFFYVFMYSYDQFVKRFFVLGMSIA